MGNICTLCNSSSKKSNQKDEGSYSKTEIGLVEKVPAIGAVEASIDTTASEIEAAANESFTASTLDDEFNDQSKKPEQGSEKIMICNSPAIMSTNESFNIDDRLPTFVTVPSPTHVKKLQASVRA